MYLYNKHYIRIDGESNIIHGFSDAFENPQDGDICINEQGGRQFVMLGEINPPLQDEQGVYLYRWANGQAITKTPQEIEAEAPPLASSAPTIEERISLLEALELERILSEE